MHNITEDESSSVPHAEYIAHYQMYLRAARLSKSFVPRDRDAAVNIPPDNPFPRPARGGGRNPRSGWDEITVGPR